MQGLPRCAQECRQSLSVKCITAVCATCGKEARVPFKPREDRPVYCSECFAKMRGEA